MKQIGALLADDHILIRAGLRIVVEGQSDLSVIGEADEGSEVRRESSRSRYTNSPVSEYRLAVTNNCPTRASIQIGPEFGGCRSILRRAQPIGVYYLPKGNTNAAFIPSLRVCSILEDGNLARKVRGGPCSGDG